MESGAITDTQISASSQATDGHAATHGRLHFQAGSGKAGSWTAGNIEANANQWLQIDLIGQYIVTRVATQGRNDADEWVKTYKLQYSNDTASLQYYREQGETSYKVRFTYKNLYK